MEETEKVLTSLLAVYEDIQLDEEKKKVFQQKEPRIMKRSFRSEILKHENMLKEYKKKP